MSKENQEETRPLRLGIAGCGLAARHLHWPALKRLSEQFEIMRLCDIDIEAAHQFAQLVGNPTLPCTTAYGELLADPAVEAVLVAVPAELTASFIEQAVAAGKHVISEKPLAANLEEAVQLIEKLNTAKTIILLAENFRYRDDFRQAREWLKEEKIGRVFLVDLQAHWWHDPTSGFPSTPWRHRKFSRYEGGVWGDAGVHLCATLRELAGEVESAHAFASVNQPVMAPPDTLVANLHFKSGALGTLTFSGATHEPSNTFCDVTIYGEKGTLYLTTPYTGILSNGPVKLVESGKEPEIYNSVAHDCGYYEEFHNFWEAVTQGKKVVSTLYEGYKDWELTMKLLESAQSEQAVTFE